ncbi:MAG: 7-cyano-7-deazaguanine synthase [Ignavibacteria bacterium]|jgi:7-cyano-7-deazaguanine synthase|nr:7-cyano-7-deazaguanine synthase [Ignavibacteria bacterium]MCU7503784.1 7-cyano-7-deazaguanine synthase [Ignavibacteria bacterium]MCU7517202.1 7-cyano-7-deazaguanine synthase [Ignavibacteria bacterium]
MKTGILLSGGMDSIALCYMTRPDYAITVDYGQRPAEAEIRSARQICDLLNIPQEVVKVDCSSIGSGDLFLKSSINISPVPEWYPFRNQLILTLASIKAVELGITDLMIGCVKSDSVHKDGTEDFIKAIDHLISLQEGEIRISAPAIHMESEELITKSGIPQSILGWAHSCHKDIYACGMCRGCFKHRRIMSNLYNEIY